MKNIILLLLLLPVKILLGQTYDISLRLDTGKTYYQTSEVNMKIHEEVNGKDIDLTTLVYGTISFKVLNRKDSVYKMECNYVHLGMKMVNNGKELAFDANKKDSNDVLSKIMGKLLNKRFIIFLTIKGKVNSIENFNRIWNDIINDYPQLSSEQKDKLLTQLKSSFGDEALKSNIEIGTAIFPEKKVAVNDKWMINSFLKSTMGVYITNHLRLADVTNDYYLIESNSDMETDHKSYFKANDIPLYYHLKGNSSTNIKMDKVTGWIIESKQKQDLKGTVEIKDSPSTPGGMSFPIEISTNGIIKS